MELMDGRGLAHNIRTKLADRVTHLKQAGIQPTLAILLVGNDERTTSYIRAKEKAGREVGIEVLIERIDVRASYTSEESGHRPNTSEEVPSRASYQLPATNYQKVEIGSLTSQIRTTLEVWNSDPTIHGIILQLPVPEGVDDEALLNAIQPDKDVDGLTATNQAAVEMGRELFPPATPMGIIRLLEHYHVPIAGSTIAVIGQGRLVGKPLTHMLKSRGAEVRTADSSTTDLAPIIHRADILISATGHPNLITPDLVEPTMVVIDAGLSEVGETLMGDVTEEAKLRAKLATPVPGGVGPMTVVSLLSNVVVAAELTGLKR